MATRLAIDMSGFPTPDEVDDMLAAVSIYGGEAVEIVEDWLEKKFNLVGRSTLEARGIEVSPPKPAPGQTEMFAEVREQIRAKRDQALTDAGL